MNRPNFYHIPTIVAQEVNAHEAFVFSVVHWFEKMKDGRCFTSNQKIAESLPYKSSPLSVANALLVLEQKGFIKRTFKDESKKIRLEIKSMVDYRVSPTDDTGYHPQMMGVSPTDEQSINTNINTDTLSKDKGAKPRPSKKQNEDVSYLIAAFKDALRSPQLDGTIGENRRYAYLCMTKFGGVVKVRDLIKAALGDDFHRERATGFKYLYYKGVELGQKSSVPYVKDYSKFKK
jgi:hypothetical protein